MKTYQYTQKPLVQLAVIQARTIGKCELKIVISKKKKKKDKRILLLFDILLVVLMNDTQF